MKLGVVGSRGLKITREDLARYIPAAADEIVCSGADLEALLKAHAKQAGLHYTAFPAESRQTGGLPSRRMLDYCDMILAFWDGKSRGVSAIIDYCAGCNKPVMIYKKRIK